MPLTRPASAEVLLPLRFDVPLALAPAATPHRSSLMGRTMDFWLMGGLSLVAFVVVYLIDHFRYSNIAFEKQLYNLPYAFSALSLVCNHPHFISSYKFAYGQGAKFVGRNWFALLAVPLALIGFLTLAYFEFNVDPLTVPWLKRVNDAVAYLPIHLTIGEEADLGSELLGLGVWTIWITVGWHYAKQAFGCTLLYARYDQYLLTTTQKMILRVNFLAVAVINFIYLLSESKGALAFIDMKVVQVLADSYLLPSAYWFSAISGAMVFAVFGYNYVKRGTLPSMNLLVVIVSFYVWWYPGIWSIQYAALMVPFFHSLQYLPFSYRRIQSQAAGKKTDLAQKAASRTTFWITVNVVAILIIGFMAFDIVPAFLDEKFESRSFAGCSFYLIAMTVFLNVHHFFMDSVVWKFNQAPVREALIDDLNA